MNVKALHDEFLSFEQKITDKYLELRQYHGLFDFARQFLDKDVDNEDELLEQLQELDVIDELSFLEYRDFLDFETHDCHLVDVNLMGLSVIKDPERDEIIVITFDQISDPYYKLIVLYDMEAYIKESLKKIKDISNHKKATYNS